MATVYLAHDLKHDRQVAIKVLKPELAAVLGADRFVQEIKTTAALSHPHILPLFDSGQVMLGGGGGGIDSSVLRSPSSVLFYVMPYIEGETIRDRLNRETQLPVADAVRITRDVADALDYAHRHGVIHRDIKPENILLHDGRPMVMDFGIALAVSAAAGGRMTETGLSLGTPHYMSPEQATADKEITGRSDIYSLGSVCYEMLAGEPPHLGNSAQQIIMKIVTEDAAPVTRLRKSVPPNVAAAVAQALEKLPADRFSTAHEFAQALADPGFTTATSVHTGGTGARRERRLAMPLAMLAALATAIAAWGWLRPAGSTGVHGPIEFFVDPPDSASRINELFLARDGSQIYATVARDTNWAIYRRTVGSRTWLRIPGTDGASLLALSPDETTLAFYDRQTGELRQVPVTGGTARSIIRVGREPNGGMAWGDGGMIYYSLDTAGGDSVQVHRAPVAGGPPEILRDSTASEFRFQPTIAPGSTLLFYTAFAGSERNNRVAVHDVATGRSALLGPGHTPREIRGDRLVYVDAEGRLVAQRFDRGTLAFEGAPAAVGDNPMAYIGAWSMVGAADDGSVAYLLAPSGRETLSLLDRSGRFLGTVPTTTVAGTVAHPRFSPDGTRVLYIGEANAINRGRAWVTDLRRRNTQPIGFDDGLQADPAWSRDGRLVGYSMVPNSPDSARAVIVVRPADGTGQGRIVMQGSAEYWQMGFGPTSDQIFFRSGNDLYRARIGRDSTPVPVTQSPELEQYADLSPDGRWMAFTSTAGGMERIHVRSYPEMGPPTIVSPGFGRFPAWGKDGKHLYYQDSGYLHEVTLALDGPRAEVVSDQPLFSTSRFIDVANRNYDVSPDGQTFVVVLSQPLRLVWRVDALAGSPE